MLAAHAPNGSGRHAARLLRASYWALMAVIAYYTAELIPRVGVWSHAQPWRDAVPFLFGWSYLLSLGGAIWHVLVNPRLGWLARLALIVSFFMLPIVGFAGYYWFGVHDRRPVGAPELA